MICEIDGEDEQAGEAVLLSFLRNCNDLYSVVVATV